MEPPTYLECISPHGAANFIPLDAARGVLNIGSDRANDVVLDAPGIQPFQALLDLRTEPASVVLFAGGAEALLGGRRVEVEVSTPLRPWETLVIGGYTLLLVSAEAREANEEATGVAAAGQAVLAGATGQIELELQPRRGVVETDQRIEFRLMAINRASEVARMSLELDFAPIAPEVSAEWCTLPLESFGCTPGEQVPFTFLLHPPRLSSSVAGQHEFRARVRARYDRGHEAAAETAGTLVILPFFEIGDAEFASRTLVISDQGANTLSIENKSNTRVQFLVLGKDPTNESMVQYRVLPQAHGGPANGIDLAPNADIDSLTALKGNPVLVDAPAGAPVDISSVFTQLRRPWVARKSRLHPYEFTLSIKDHEQVSRPLQLKVQSEPRVYLWQALLGGLLAALVIFVGWVLVTFPDVKARWEVTPATSSAPGSSGPAHLAVLVSTRQDQEVGECDRNEPTCSVTPSEPSDTITATWTMTGLGEVTISELDFGGKPIGEPEIVRPITNTVVRAFPGRNAIYRLEVRHPLADNPVVRLLNLANVFVRRAPDLQISLDKPGSPGGRWSLDPAPRPPLPNAPKTVTFSSHDGTIRTVPATEAVSIVPGGTVTVWWDQIGLADRLVLLKNNVPIEIPKEEHGAGQRQFQLDETTVFALKASNSAHSESLLASDGGAKSLTAIVLPPTPTPGTPPKIARFEIMPPEVAAGDKVAILWEVAPADGPQTVTLDMDGVSTVVDLTGSVFQIPVDPGNGFRTYRLLVEGEHGSTATARQVQIIAPTPIPTAQPIFLGKPDYDAFCGGIGRSDIRFMPVNDNWNWRWVCLDRPEIPITDATCMLQYVEGAFGKAVGNPKEKASWECWG